MEQIFEDTIYGKMNSEIQSDKLIIFIHGLGGNINEHIFFNGYKFFNSKGYDTFRIDLYAQNKLTDNTIKQHSADLDKVIKYFKDKYSELYLIGHSLGGPVVLQSDIDSIKKVVLWDPVLDCKSLLKQELLHKDNICCVSWGMDILIGKEMEQEINNTGDLNSNLTGKCSIIYAEDSVWKSQLNNLEIKNYIITGADHCFNNDGNENELLSKTLEFIKN